MQEYLHTVFTVVGRGVGTLDSSPQTILYQQIKGHATIMHGKQKMNANTSPAFAIDRL